MDPSLVAVLPQSLQKRILRLVEEDDGAAASRSVETADLEGAAGAKLRSDGYCVLDNYCRLTRQSLLVRR